MSARLHHVSLSVRDPEKIAAFYQEHFGLNIERKFRATTGAEVTCLGAGGSIVELVSSDAPPTGSGPITHFCLEVDDLEAACERLKLHVSLTKPPAYSPGAGVRFAFFIDPAGIGVELFEAPHKQEQR